MGVANPTIFGVPSPQKSWCPISNQCIYGFFFDYVCIYFSRELPQ